MRNAHNQNLRGMQAHPLASLCRFVLPLLLLLVSLAAPLEQSYAQQPGHKPRQVAVGFYLNRIYDVSHKNGTFGIDAWFWFRWKGSELNPAKTFDIVNGRIESAVPTEVLDDGGFKYSSVRVHATVYEEFDVTRYPLDDHLLEIQIEDSTSQAPLLLLASDEGSMIDPQVRHEGWKVAYAGERAESHAYPTTYGYRSLGEGASKFARLTFNISLTRESSIVSLMKLFWVSLLALLLAIGALFVRSNDLDARFGLGLGSIFAASANTIAVSANLPDTPVLTLAERINMVTVLAIFLTIFISIASLRLRYRGKDLAADRLDMRSAVVISIAYSATLFSVLYFL